MSNEMQTNNYSKSQTIGNLLIWEIKKPKNYAIAIWMIYSNCYLHLLDFSNEIFYVNLAFETNWLKKTAKKTDKYSCFWK